MKGLYLKEPINRVIIFLKCILHCLSPKRKQQTCHFTLDLKSLSYFNAINHKHININILNSIYIEVYQFGVFFKFTFGNVCNLWYMVHRDMEAEF